MRRSGEEIIHRITIYDLVHRIIFFRRRSRATACFIIGSAVVKVVPIISLSHSSPILAVLVILHGTRSRSFIRPSLLEQTNCPGRDPRTVVLVSPVRQHHSCDTERTDIRIVLPEPSIKTQSAVLTTTAPWCIRS